MLDAPVRKFRDMDQSFNLILLRAFQVSERAELGQFRDRALHELTFFILSYDVFPWVSFKFSKRQADSLPFRIDTQNLNLHFLPHFDDFARMRDSFP